MTHINWTLEQQHEIRSLMEKADISVDDLIMVLRKKVAVKSITELVGLLDNDRKIPLNVHLPKKYKNIKRKQHKLD